MRGEARGEASSSVIELSGIQSWCPREDSRLCWTHLLNVNVVAGPCAYNSVSSFLRLTLSLHTCPPI